MSRVVILVIDSGGVGALPDASGYGDAPAANTLGNTARAIGGLHLPTLQRWGLGNLTALEGVPAAPTPAARVARLAEQSRGKDTITGHWEMAGIVTEVPFPTYPDGFPPEVIEAFTAIVGKAPLGNTARAIGGLHLPTLQRWGLGNLTALEGVPAAATPAARSHSLGDSPSARKRPAPRRRGGRSLG